MPIVRKKHRHLIPARVLLIGFTIAIILGTIMLILPAASKSGKTLGFTNALFTATSATCVTGISVLDTYSSFTTFGHIVIMVLLQLGGIGLLTFVTFFNIIIGKKVGLIHSKDLVSEHSLGGFTDLRSVFSRVIIYSFSFEIIGALSYMYVFVSEHGEYGVFMAFFSAVSAFCNGGFNLFGINGLPVPELMYMKYPLFQFTTMFLVMTGGFGFVVWHNLITYYRTRKLTMHTKIVLAGSGVLILIGAVIYYILVAWNPSYNNLSFGEKVLGSFFTSVSARTSGFFGYGFASSNELTELFTMLLMFIGGAPGSTAGGIKVTTFVILAATIISVLKGREDTVLMKHIVVKEIIYKSITVLCLSLFFLTVAFAAVYTMHMEYRPVDILFEVTSAFTTTGFSNGFSAKASALAKAVIIMTMFIGRIGPVSLILSLSVGKREESGEVYPQSTILVG